jgi:hypothetical protein
MGRAIPASAVPGAEHMVFSAWHEVFCGMTLGVRIDDAGIIRSVGTGHWSIAEVDAYYAKVRALIATQRTAGRPIRVFIDATKAEMQAPHVQERIQGHGKGLYEANDRVAIVVPNTLFKARGREIAPSNAVCYFCSQTAAETWLFAYDERVSA